MALPPASQRLHDIATRLKAEGERGLRLEMNRTIRAIAQPLVDAVRAEAREKLPKSGGLAEVQAEQAIRIAIVTGSRSAGVRIRTKTRGSMQTDKGYVRHPVFGEWRKDMPSQEIPEATGWWSATLAARSAAITPLIVKAMNRIASRAARGY